VAVVHLKGRTLNQEVFLNQSKDDGMWISACSCFGLRERTWAGGRRLMVGMPFNSRLWVWGGGKSLLAGPKAKAAHFAKASTISFPTKPT
jgi:hypothetical protein